MMVWLGRQAGINAVTKVVRVDRPLDIGPLYESRNAASDTRQTIVLGLGDNTYPRFFECFFPTRFADLRVLTPSQQGTKWKAMPPR